MQKRVLLLFVFLLIGSVLFSQEEPWFQDVKQPVACSENALADFTAKLRAGLLAKKPAKELLALSPVQDNAPRVLFLTLNDGLFPGRTYYSVGKTFNDALAMLLAIVAKREPEYAEAITADLSGQLAKAKEEKRLLPAYVKTKLDNPNAWDSLRLDIVQATLPIDSFVVNSSRLLLSSMVGIAFDRTAAFAFTPEQLTGRYLMTPERQISVTRVGNLIAEANLWNAMGLWQQMGSSSQPFKVTLFETDSYYADANGVRKLFRAHPVKQLQQPSASAVIDLAKRCTTLLDAKKGILLSPFPEWFECRSTEKTSLFDQASLAMALLDARELAKDDKTKDDLLASAILATKPLLKSIKHLDAGEKSENGELVQKNRKPANQRAFAMLVEEENNPYASEIEIPARVSELRADALAYLLFRRLGKICPQDNKTAQECREELQQLYRHIATQISDMGTCIPAVIYPTRAMKTTLVGDDLISAHDDLETAALAGMALEAHLEDYSAAGNDQLRKALAQLRDALGERLLGTLEEGPYSVFLVEYLAKDATEKNPQRLAQLARLALAAVENLELSSAIPDMFGCDSDIPSMTYAAQRLEVVATAAMILANAGKAEDAQGLLQEAWPLWVFQQQAAIGPEAASVLPQPAKYLGFQRDNLADYGFTLDGQTTQMRSQQKLLQALETLKINAFNPTDDQKNAWENGWKIIDQHPICLAPELVLKGFATEENGRAIGNAKTEEGEIRYQISGSNLGVKLNPDGGKNHVETKVIDRNKPAKKGKKKKK